jgi:WD40 repeat protein
LIRSNPKRIEVIRYFQFLIAPLLFVIASLATGWSAGTDAPEAQKNHNGARSDRYGDLLPDGAVARFGTLRFRHAGEVTSLAFSPDGKLIASGSWDTTARLWDAATGKELYRAHAIEDGASAVAFSPRGRVLAIVDERGGIYLWEWAVGQKRLVKALPDPGDVSFRPTPLVFSPDGATLAFALRNRIHVCDVRAGKEIRWLGKKDNNQFVFCLAFSPDGRMLASGNSDKAITLWDWRTGKSIRSLSGNEENALAIAFSADSKHLMSVDRWAGIRLWDVARGTTIREVGGGTETYSSMSFFGDGRYFLGNGDEGGARVWDVANAKEIQRLGAVPRLFSGVAISPNGKRLAAGIGHAVRLWDLTRGAEVTSGDEPRMPADFLAFTSGDKTIISASENMPPRLWDAATGKEVRRFERGMRRYGCAALSGDGRTLATGEPDGKLRLWDVASGKILKKGKTKDRSLSCLAFSANGQLLAAGGASIRIAELPSGKILNQFGDLFPERTSLWWTSAVLSPDGKVLAAGLGALKSNGPAVVLWAVPDCEPIQLPNIEGLDTEGLDCVAFSPDGKVAALNFGRSKGRSEVCLMELASGQVRLAWKGTREESFRTIPSKESAVAFSPDCETLGVARASGDVALWDTWGPNQSRDLRLVGAHGARVDLVAFSRDGKRIASAGWDTTVLVWGVPARKARPQRRVDAREFQDLWRNLASDDATTAYRAACILRHAPNQAVSWFREKMHPFPLKDPPSIARLMVDIDSKDYDVRNAAYEELGKRLEDAEPALQRAKKAHATAAVRECANELLKQLERAPDTERLRELRVIEILEHIATPEAREVLESLNKGNPDSRVTREAKASLARLNP